MTNVDVTGQDLFWDEIFTLPDSALPDQTYRMMYTFIIEQLKKDVAGSKMQTLEWLNLERTAAKYVACRVYEARGMENINPLTMDKLDSAFLNMASLLSKNIQKITPEEERQRINEQVAKAIKTVVTDKIKDPEVRKEVLKGLAQAL